MAPRARPLGEVLAFIGANVRRLRTEAHLTQDELAGFSGQDLSYLKRIERGVANPSAAVLVALSNALDVSPGSLFRPTKIPRRRHGRPRRTRS
ncbi:MAG TPA: helix-turn-helix transcriptional regulator [Polyangiaceae bacterium]|nr:helix-turn-helix transcriptional regulator [Polyangiaceae bacterium]